MVYGEGCYQCFVEYVSELEELVDKSNSNLRVEYLESSYLAKNELNLLFDELGVPTEYSGSMVVAVERRYLFINYIPIESITEFLEREGAEESKYIVHWNELEATYTVIDEYGYIYKCEKDSFTECIEPTAAQNPNTMLIVVVSGLLDGINPCAFTVLVFMITMLYTIQSMDEKNSNLILKVGSAYIVAVFLGYLAIGLALFQAVTISGASKLFEVRGCTVVHFGFN